jgi:hypothetical protein
VEATFKDGGAGRHSPLQAAEKLPPTSRDLAAEGAEARASSGASTRLRFTTNTTVQPAVGETTVQPAAGESAEAAGPPPYTPPPAVTTTTRGHQQDTGDDALLGTTNVEILSSSPSPRRRESSTSSVGTNTEIEVFCTTTAAAEPVAKEINLAELPAALFGDQPFEKGAEEEEVVKGKEGLGGGKKGRVRAAIDAVGLSAVCFYLVVWLALFLFNAVCLCLLWFMVPCFWRSQTGCILLPACPAWAPTAAGLQHPI